MADIFAADRVVSLTAGVGTDLTIQDAVNNLPAKGGKISIKHGTFPISSAIVLPDKNIIFEGGGWGTVLDMGANAITMFQAPNGLSKSRMYTFKNMTVLGTDGVAQTFFASLDTNGRASVTVLDSRLGGDATATGIQKIFDYQAYDTTFTNIARVQVERCVINAPSAAGAMLIKTPNPAGTFGGLISFTAISTIFGITSAPFFSGQKKWGCDLDGDMLLIGQGFLWPANGFGANGLVVNAMALIVDVGVTMTAFGGGFGKININLTDTQLLGTSLGQGIVVFEFTAIVKGCRSIGIPIKFEARALESTVEGNFFNNTSPFGIRINGVNAVAITENTFEGISGNAVELIDAVNCKVADNHFHQLAVNNKTVEESGASDSNIIHDNTGYLSGGGPTIIGASTLVHDNLP